MKNIKALCLLILAFLIVGCGDNSVVTKPVPTPGVCEQKRFPAFPALSGTCVTDSDDAIHRALSNEIGVPEHRSQFKKEFSFTTPAGARVYSVVQIPDEFKAEIDPAIQFTIDRYAKVFPDWKYYSSPVDYDLMVITGNCVGDTNPEVIGAPLLCFNGGWAAGTGFGAGPNSAVQKTYMVIPHEDFALVDRGISSGYDQVDADWKYKNLWINSIRNEAEHLKEKANSEEYFQKFTGWNDVHPHQIP